MHDHNKENYSESSKNEDQNFDIGNEPRSKSNDDSNKEDVKTKTKKKDRRDCKNNQKIENIKQNRGEVTVKTARLRSEYL